MSIRLNKAISELNIGLQTAVDYLEKRKELGEVKNDPNFKLSDEQHEALVEHFKSDATVKNDAAKLLTKKVKEKKTKVEAAMKKGEDLLTKTRQVFKPLGKIDLDHPGKNAEADQTAKETIEPEVKAEEAAPVVETAAVAEPQVETKEEVKPQELPEVAATAEEKPADEFSADEETTAADNSRQEEEPVAGTGEETKEHFGITGRFLLGADTEDTESAQIHMMTIEYEEKDGLTYGDGTGSKGRFRNVRRLRNITYQLISFHFRIVHNMTDDAVFIKHSYTLIDSFYFNLSHNRYNFTLDKLVFAIHFLFDATNIQHFSDNTMYLEK